MVRFEISVDINKSPEIVDSALWLPDNALYWTRYLERFEVVKGKPREVGAVGRMHYIQDGREYIMEDVLLYSDPGRRYRSRVSGPAISAMVETILEPIEGKTRMKIVWDGKGKVLFLRLLLPLLKRKMTREAEKELKTFKSLIESYGIDFSKSKREKGIKP